MLLWCSPYCKRAWLPAIAKPQTGILGDFRLEQVLFIMSFAGRQSFPLSVSVLNVTSAVQGQWADEDSLPSALQGQYTPDQLQLLCLSQVSCYALRNNDTMH